METDETIKELPISSLIGDISVLITVIDLNNKLLWAVPNNTVCFVMSPDNNAPDLNKPLEINTINPGEKIWIQDLKLTEQYLLCETIYPYPRT